VPTPLNFHSLAIPVEQATKFEFVIVPSTLLGRADEVIE